MLLMPDFASKLNHLLSARGLTQADLREAIGRTVSNATVSHWCSGKSLPRLDEAYKVASVLDVPLEFLADDSKAAPEVQPPDGLTDREREIVSIIRKLGVERAERRLLGIPHPDDIRPASWD